jgi:uncharacterized protein (DUF305 family)
MFNWSRIVWKGMAVVALVLAVAGSFTRSALASPVGQTETDMEHLSGLSGQEFETQWMSMMIQHHQGAVEMAQLAETRAAHQEIKTVAQNIIRDQTREIGELTTWLKQWYNAEPMTGTMGGMHGGMDVNMLQGASGDDFDKAFLMMMHEHHRGALAMAELVPERATHQELKTLAQNIIAAQEAEIQQFMEWAMSWYNLDLMAGMGGAGTSTAPVGMPRTGGPSPAFLLATLLLGVTGLAIAGGVWVRRKA